MRNINHKEVNHLCIESNGELKYYEDIEVWKAIVSGKRKKSRIILETYETNVSNRYDLYDEISYDLGLMRKTHDINLIKNKELLNSCYGNNKVFNLVKKNLFKKVIYCPYCLLNKANSIDHYFDKNSYPEYSVYIPNLIPCCSECNTKKGVQMFKEDGNRKYIHFYFDNLPLDKFLYFNFILKEKSNVPEVEVYIKFDYESNISILINNHFEALNLINEYKRILNVKISEFINHCKFSYESGININDFKEVIKSNYYSLVNKYGYNYFESCFYEGVLSSHEFIEKNYK